MKKVVIITPHPDDEVLGCGGAILKHIDNGDKVYIIFITSVDKEKRKERYISRKKEISEVCRKLSVEKDYQLDFITTTLDFSSLGKLIGKISKIFHEIKPQIVYVNNRNDIHSDHRVIFEAAMSCTKSFRYPFIEKVLMYEVISETDYAIEAFNPNYFVDISKYHEKKIEVMKIYSSEVMEYPLSRSISSIEALARYRGSRIGVEYAEAFMLIYEKR